ncbi:hypothetical protein DZF91_33570, partial [Actinomadura logoneensis]
GKGAGWRPAPGRAALLWAAGAVVAGTAAAWTLNTVVSAALYPGGPSDHQAWAVERLTSPSGLLHSLTAGGGQLWAMAAGSWGLAALGLVSVLLAVRRGRPADRLMALALLVATAGVAVASAAALFDEHRVGNFAYERYVACFALPYALAGLAGLRRHRRMLAGAASVCLFGGWLVLYMGGRLHTYTFKSRDFPEVALLGGSYTELRPIVISAAASALLALLWALARWGTVKLAGVLLALNLVLTYIPATVWQVSEAVADAAPLPPVTSGSVVLARHVPGVEHPVPDVVSPVSELTYSSVAVKVWWTRLERFDPSAGVRPGVCMAVVEWPAGVTAAETWPQHPPGWSYRRSALMENLWWVIWYDPACVGRKGSR